MKYLIIFIISHFSFSSIHAQQNHFIYLQSDNKQPFYVKLDNKILSSSSSGYLIISRLIEGNYKFVVGFPKNEWAEQTLNVAVNKKDAGYLLKNFGEKGWGLFDLQTNEVVMAGNTAVKQDKIYQVKETDPFSTMLANVINDSTLLQKDVVKNEIVKDPETTKKSESGENNDSAVQKDIIKLKDEPKEIVINTVPEKTDISLSMVRRTLRRKTKEGTELVYVDEYDNRKDTIRIFIPNEKEIKRDTVESKDVVITTEVVPEQKSDEKNKDVAVKPDTLAVQNGEEKNKDVALSANLPSGKKKKSNSGEKKSKEQKVVNEANPDLKDDPANSKTYQFIEDKKEKQGITTSAMINSDCKTFAGDDDFLKLRKKMAAETNEEDMIKVAKKAFKLKCYSTQLIKNLSLLFLKDEGKYMFFDVAYPFVSDSDAFSTLQSQLSDSYYINRFNAMVHK